MFENGGNDRHVRPMILQHPVTTGLLAINILIYAFQYYVAPKVCPNFSIEDRFALSLDGLRAGHFWQLLTFQFLHGGLLHIGFNCWAIYIFGQVVESALGRRRMLTLYLTGGVVGGIFQMISAWLWPRLFDGPVVGASAGACALLAAFAALYPVQRMLVLLLLVIPIYMRARTMLRVLIAVTMFGLLWPVLRELPALQHPFARWDHSFEALSAVLKKHGFQIGDGGIGAVAHGGHLGGLVTGIAGARWFIRRYGPIRPGDTPPELNEADDLKANP